MIGTKCKLGERYGRLVILKLALRGWSQQGHLVKCDCGKKLRVNSGRLLVGSVQSCGCMRSENMARRNKAKAIHNLHATPTYNSWRAMWSRCTNPNKQGFKRYGGRGIRVCKRWESFKSFAEDMGIKPPGKSIDRINNDGNYKPSNCRWSTPKEQKDPTLHK